MQVKLSALFFKRWNDSYFLLFLSYHMFGAVHELIHFLFAVFTNPKIISEIKRNKLWVNLLKMILMDRHCQIPNNANLYHEFLNYHVGWIGSVFIAYLMNRRNKNEQFFHYKMIEIAAYITALEAISTDLLGLPTLSLFSRQLTNETEKIYYCGNFGAIFINSVWMNADGGKAALELLEKLASVTKIRGAQSGGVVTFLKNQNEENLTGIRDRVVSGKRSDLSKEIRKKVERHVFHSRIFHRKKFPENFVHTFVGHTRFATSSKSTLDGTHPHRWTPPTNWKFFDVTSNTETKNLTTIRVENYVTHNGDFDFFELNDSTHELSEVQKWLELVTEAKMPSVTDSTAIAGMIDLLRTQGSFGLSIRFVVCIGLPSCRISEDDRIPSKAAYQNLASYFERPLQEILKHKPFNSISENPGERMKFAAKVLPALEKNIHNISPYFKRHISLDNEEGGVSLMYFIQATIDAFFDNDLFFATKFFLAHAKGSFGLCVTSSLDAKRQICFAARGQTMSVAFYPTIGLICYGSEQAAVKAGMSVPFPGNKPDILDKSHLDIDNDSLRLDLDDLGGEICLLDWHNRAYHSKATISPLNRSIVETYRVMNGLVNVLIYRESKTTLQSPHLYHRMTRLTRNEFITPLEKDEYDYVHKDIRDIPKICQNIQDDWRNLNSTKTLSINRLSAWNLSRCLRHRLNARLEGKKYQSSHCVDILLTGCEVSLWLSEQVASDLQKSFPKLNIKAMSSNKILALYGQETSIPATGFSFSQKTQKFDDTIVVIVSHSGGTFAPLACASLLQSFTKHIFVVTSEWDTQIGKQLRRIDENEHELSTFLFNSRIFTTMVGMRPAEPSSVSVAATHQLLTNLFEHICIVILSSQKFRQVSGAVITQRDVKILERLNIENIYALSSIVGVDAANPIELNESNTEKELRKLGRIWAEHILENVKAYIMSIVYILVTVTMGCPIFSLISSLGGLSFSSSHFYLIRFLDSLVYIFLPQINVIILRLIQRRSLRHRMVGRTIVIMDIPWVSQAADAFLSKLFACSYSIAGLNVLNGNPCDHLVHKHTHRIVRGTLLVCGRPDGRLSALSSSETTVGLSVNQACSIQSLGGTAECITIGHNPFKLPLSKYAIFLERMRPTFLCERFLDELDRSISRKRQRKTNARSSSFNRLSSATATGYTEKKKKKEPRSSAALSGAYKNLAKKLMDNYDGTLSITDIAGEAIHEQNWYDDSRSLFEALDTTGKGSLDMEEFRNGFQRFNQSYTKFQLNKIFEEADLDEYGNLSYKEFNKIIKMNPVELDLLLQRKNRDSRGLIQVEANTERYFGEKMREHFSFTAEGDESFFTAIKSQYFSQELYESRIASHQRFVAMTVLFHEIGKRVEHFFRKISFGLLGYEIHKTHSVMRVATTASPVSAAEVRERLFILHMITKINHSMNVISTAWLQYKQRKDEMLRSK